MRYITRTLLDPLLKQGSGRGLDAGCGTRHNALEWERLYGVQMYGIDRAPLAIQYCWKKSFSRSCVASVVQLPFADHCFDWVISLEVLSHLAPGEDSQTLEEWARVLRPGGWLFLRLPAFPMLRSRHSQWIGEQHRYRAGELLDKLAASRFQVIRWTYANSLLSPIALVKFRIWENLFQKEPQSGVAQIPPAWLNGLLLSILKLEAVWIRAGFSFPFGQSLMVLARAPARL